MAHRFEDSLKNDSKFVVLVFILPFLAAMLILALSTLNLLVRGPLVESPPAPSDQDNSTSESTLNGGVIENNGLTVHEVTASVGGDFTQQAIMQSSSEILLVTGGSSSCPVNFTDISLDGSTIILDARAGDDVTVACTEDWHAQSFLITSNEPIDVMTVKLNYATNDKTVALDVVHPIFEGTTLDNQTLGWSKYSLREIPKSSYSDYPEISTLLKSTKQPQAYPALNGDRIFFSYGGSSTCPVNFISMNVYEQELQLISRAGDTDSVCTAEYEVKVFEVTGSDLASIDSIVVQASEYLDQNVKVPFVELESD